MKRLAILAAVLAAVCLLSLRWFAGRGATREALPTPVAAPVAPRAPLVELESAPIVAPASSATASLEDVPESSERTPAAARAAQRPILVTGVLLAHATPDAPGRPLAGVQVSLGGAFSGIGSGGRPERVVTGDDGRFRFEPGAPVERPLGFDLWCVPGSTYLPTRQQVWLQEGEHVVEDLELHLRPYGELEGVVVDEHGALLEGARLRFEQHGADTPIEIESDERGAFRVAGAAGLQLAGVELAGALPIALPRTRALADGGYEPMRVVLAIGTGRLVVRCEDRAGAPLASVPILVSLSSAGHDAIHVLGALQRGQRPLYMRTGEDGTARFPQVWAGQKLSLSIGLGRRPMDARCRVGDRIVASAPAGAQSIVLAAGEELSLRAVLSAAVTLRGRVEDERGDAVEGAQVGLRAFDDERADFLSSETAEARTDAAGAFTLELPAGRELKRALLFASCEEVADEHGRAHQAVAQQWLEDPSAAAARELHLTLVPTRAIAGRVVDAEGEAVMASVWARPEGPRSDPVVARMATGVRAATQADGSFRFDGLPAGRYRIEARPHERFARVRVDAVEAGAEDVLLRVAGELSVHVEFEVAGRGVALARGAAWIARLEPWDAPPRGATVLARDTSLRLPGGLPRPPSDAFGGVGDFLEERGLVVDVRQEPLVAGRVSCALDPGWYWLGALGSSDAGGTLFPSGTGLARLDSGTYRVRIELAPGAALSGRVRAPEGSDELFIALARPDGELLALDVGNGRKHTLHELDASGSFHLPNAPVGSFELRVGSATELADGGARHRRGIVIEADGTPVVEIELAD